jgi:hypothetical protein
MMCRRLCVTGLVDDEAVFPFLRPDEGATSSCAPVRRYGVHLWTLTSLVIHEILSNSGVAAAILMSAAVAEAQTIASVAGCYRFDRHYFGFITSYDQNTGRYTADSTAVMRLFPGRDTLHADTLTHGGGLRVMPIPFGADTATRRRWHNLSSWQLTPSGDINISWFSGFFGPLFRFKATGDTLRGTVLHRTDVIVAGQSPVPVSASAVRTLCPITRVP